MNKYDVKNLLRQYNADLYERRDAQEDLNVSAEGPKLATASYASGTEYLLDKYRNDPNFSADMFHQAEALGEQDTYLALIAQNAGQKMSDKFYDPKYRTYESTLLELYKSTADTENKKEEFKRTFDPVTNTWIDESLGEMSEYERVQYDLDQNYAAQDAEITRKLEQYRKDTMSAMEKIGSHTGAVLGELGEGVLTALTGIMDIGGSLGYATTMRALGKSDNWLDAFVEYYGELSYTKAEKENVRAALDEYERKYTTFRTIDGDITTAGKYVANIANSIGMMIPSIITAGATAGTSFVGLGQASFYASIFSGNMYDNATRASTLGSPSWVKVTNAAATSAAEWLIEWGLNKILGGTIQNHLLGMGGKGLPGGFKQLSNLQGFKYMLKSAGQEGIEEFLQDYGTHCVNTFTDLLYEGYGNDGVTLQTLMDSFFAGVLSSLVLSGAHISNQEIGSAATNFVAKRKGEYDKTRKIGPGDVIIEPTPDKYEKVRGFKRFAYTSIMNDFQDAVKRLEQGKGAQADLKLAQEVYAGITQMTQYFASFDQDRLSRCQFFLGRLQVLHELGDTLVTSGKPAKSRAEQAKIFANSVWTALDSIVGSPYKSARSAALIETLQNGGVSEVTGGHSAEGGFKWLKRREGKTPYATSLLSNLGKRTSVADSEDVETSTVAQQTDEEATNPLSAEAEAKLEALVKKYEHVFTTDGHTATEDGNSLFVSEAWLENYELSEIYKFLVQADVFEKLAKDNARQPMIEKAWEFAEKFTGRQLDWEEALMNLFFNENMYQAFLLSNSGENLHEFKHLIMGLPETIRALAKDYADSSEKKVQLENLFNDMRAAMREPTMVAILNWNYEPQMIMADLILDPADLELIQQKKGRERTITQGEGGAYQRLAKDLLKMGDFTDEEKAFIQRTLDDPNASDRDRLVVQAMLDEADRRYTTSDFSMRSQGFNNIVANTIRNIVRPIRRFAELSEADITAAKNDEFFGTNPETDAKEEFFANMQYLLEVYRSVRKTELDEALLDEYNALGIDLNEFASIGIDQPIDEYIFIVSRLLDFSEKLKDAVYISKTGFRPGLKGSFIIDPRAFFDGWERADEVQHIDDTLKEFAGEYGIPADQMYVRVLDGITKENFDKLQSDMTAMGVDDYQQFVTRRLEQMLGPDYVVAPSYENAYYNVEPFSFNDKDVSEKFWQTYSEVLSHAYTIGVDYDDNRGKPVSAEIHGVIEELLDLLSILSSPADEYNSKPSLSDELSDKLRKLNDAIAMKGDAYIRKYIATHQEVLDQIRLGLMDELELSLFGPEPIDNYITDFKIAKKIPADKVLISELTTGTREERRNALVDLLSKPVLLYELVSTNNEQIKAEIRKWIVRVSDKGDGALAAATYPDKKEIVLYTNVSDDLVHDLGHEINHVLQEVMGLNPGGNTKIVKNRKLFTHLLTNYREYVEYVARRAYDSQMLSWLKQNGDKPFTSAPVQVVEQLSYCAYRLLSGEMWAEHFDHNGRPTRGYARVLENGEMYIVSPDGKERFELGGLFSLSTLQASYDPNAKISPELAGQALANALEEVADIIGSADQTSYRRSDDIRNTYHTAFTKSSALTLLTDVGIVSPERRMAAAIYGERITINDIITNPEAFLSDEFIAEMLEWRTDLSEGNVYYYLRELIEDRAPGISIDRDARTHEYILVNDNAFDDLLLPKVIAKAEGDEATLAKKYLNTEATLGDFYSVPVLRKMNISSELPVIIRSDVRSQFVVNKTHPFGVIYVNADENTKDVRLIDTLNHEFRHLQQRYNQFEGGFTLNFTVTAEMLADFEKHAPALFAQERLKKWAQRAAGKDWKAYLVRQAIYRLTGGELNAFGITANALTTKPVYVTYEAGNPVIFLPWYDAKTGEGRHKTTAMAYREDTDAPPMPPKKGGKKTEPKRKSGYTGERFRNDRSSTEGFDLPVQTEDPHLEKGMRRRYVSKKQAEGTNLEFFTRKLKPGERAEIDPRVQDFVLAADLSKLDPVLKHAIERGVLNMQTLNGWLINEKTDVTEIDDYTFRLLAKHIYHNDKIKSGRELQQILDKTLDGTWWASAIVLRGGIRNEEGGVDRAAIESLLAQNDLGTFMAFYNSLEGSTWKKHIDKKAVDFTRYYDIDNKTIQLVGNDTVQRAARVFALRYFDGSLAGAHHVANVYRRAVAQYENEIGNAVSLDKSTKNKKGDENRGTLAEQMTEKNRIQSDNIIRDIVALYEEEVGIDLDEDERQRMRTELVLARMRGEGWEASSPELKKWVKTVLEFDNAELASLYAQYENDGIIGEILKPEGKTTDTNTKVFDYDPTKNRVNIVNRIKNAGRRLLKLVNSGEIAWRDLPNEVKELFEEVEVEVRNPETKKVTKRKEYQLKASAYQVGRGRAALKGGADAGRRMTYSSTRDLREGTDKFKHDVSQILANEQLLKNTIQAIKETAKIRKGDATKVRGIVRNAQFIMQETVDAKSENVKSTTVTVRKTRKVREKSDTPNHFTIVSNVDMPESLKRIFDTSFNDMADTLVQFASKDENGNLYEKGTKDFESRLQHEITTWDAFYEANRDNFLELTRTEVLAILDFFLNGATTFNGPAGKLAAFEIFTLGYIVDAARHDISGWHFSASEIDNIEKLYEAKASALGSGLNAVSQMKKVIDPLKKVQEAYFEQFNILPEESERLFGALTELENATEKNAREKAMAKVTAEINMLEDLIRNRDPRERGWNKNLGTKIKNWRYMSMLSSPATWARNRVSNVVTTWFVNWSDVIGNAFVKKGYREDQWNLTGVQVTPEVREFIQDFFMDNPVFESLYKYTSKYDDAAKIKKRQQKEGHTLFVQMVSEALQKKYAAEHRWDKETMNRVSNWVSNRMSDEKFVKKATEKYFGKMLTIAIDRGQAKIDKGLGSEGVLSIFAEAVIIANEDYMHKRNAISDMFDSIKTTHPVAYNAITLWQPFAAAGWNWFVEGLKYSPLGLITNVIRLHRLEANIARAEELRNRGRAVSHSRFTEYLIRRDIGKGIIGGILWTMGIFFAYFGVLRIVEDDDDKTFYIVAGDVKFDISEIFGSSSLLTGVAIAQSFFKQADGTKMSYDDVLGVVADNMLSGFLLTDVLERHKWAENSFEHATVEIESFAKSYVPQIWQMFVRTTSNRKIKYSSGIKGAFERWVNSWHPTMPAGNNRINPYTGEIENKYSLPILPGITGELLKSGMLTAGTRILYSPVTEQEMLCREYDIAKNPLTGEITIDSKKHQLSDNIMLNQVYGKLNAEDLQKIKSQNHRVQMPNGTYKQLSWDNMSREQRQNVIKRTFTENAEIAKVYVWTQKMGNKYYASQSIYTELRQMGITRNVYQGDKGFVE